jgi:putative endonuclease
MGTNRRQEGAHAEELAARYLVARAYRVLHRNYQIRSGELDLVVSAKDGTLCFVEVRARADVSYGEPAETVTRSKRSRLISAARHYLATQARGEPPCRFDVVEVVGDISGAPLIRHIEDAFRLDDF